MRTWRTIDAHCQACHGKGEVMTDQMRDGEYWCTFSTCHCVEIHHDPEMKAFLRGVTALSSAYRGKSDDT